MKDMLLAYKIYLQTLNHIQEGYEIVGDRLILERLKKELNIEEKEDNNDSLLRLKR